MILHPITTRNKQKINCNQCKHINIHTALYMLESRVLSMHSDSFMITVTNYNVICIFFFLCVLHTYGLFINNPPTTNKQTNN